MEQWEQWFQEKQVERTINALKKNNFEALFVPDSKTAFEEVMKRIPDGATVGIGGSVTLTQINCWRPWEKGRSSFIWPFQQAKNEEERLGIDPEILFCRYLSFKHQCCNRGWKIVQCGCFGQSGWSHVYWSQKDDHRLRSEQDC